MKRIRKNILTVILLLQVVLIQAQLSEKYWVSLDTLNKSFLFDLKYATTDNFVSQKIYPCPKCYLKKEAALALNKLQRVLDNYCLKLLFYDCYRPKEAQIKLWNIFPNPNYVTPPTRGSMHTRGLAVDITVASEAGTPFDMGTTFDFFGQEAHHNYKNLSDTIINNRIFLKTIMEKAGFKAIRTEWWHYSFSIDKVENPQLESIFWKCD